MAGRPIQVIMFPDLFIHGITKSHAEAQMEIWTTVT